MYIHPEKDSFSKVELAFYPAQLDTTSFTGWIHDRMEINVEKRLMTLDLQMILKPFTNRPGKQWWAGEHAGKFLHAATLAWQFTGRDDLFTRLKFVAEQLIATQQIDGYLGTYAPKDQLSEGDGLGWDGPVWDVWTHKYAIIGLLSYHLATDEPRALRACVLATDKLFNHFVSNRRPMRLASAHVGMAATSILEPIATLYRITGDEKYLAFCEYIVASWEDLDNPYTWKYEDGSQILNSLLGHGNVHKTANRKAYEMLSNLVGLLELYRVHPKQDYLTACVNAWSDITTKRLYVTGTTSYFEQFTPDHRLPPGEAVGEGCVTVTWLQLNFHLLRLTGEVQYADELEKTLYNALPAAQSPLTGEVTYFAPLVGKKSYGSHDKGEPAISCCSSSVPRGVAMTPLFVSGLLHGNPTLLQYVAGTHVLTDYLSLVVCCDYPLSGQIQVTVLVDVKQSFQLVFRVPTWATGFTASVAGVTYKVEGERWLHIERDWISGDKVTIDIPLEFRLIEDGDETTNSVAFARGPEILATDTSIDKTNGLPDSKRWGDTVHVCEALKNGETKQFRLVNFADAGQNKEPYCVLHDDVKIP